MKMRNNWMALGAALAAAAMLASTTAWARGARSAKELRAVDDLSTNALPEPSDWEFLGRLPSWSSATNIDVSVVLGIGSNLDQRVSVDQTGAFSLRLPSSLLKAMVEHGAPWTVAVAPAQSASPGQPVSLASYPYALFARRVAKSRGAFEVAGGGSAAQGAGGSLRVGGQTRAEAISATGKLSAGGLVVTNKLDVKGSLKVQGALSAQSVAGAGTLPVGAVILWYGDAGNVPDGWHICDGDEGTPDLRERFVIGAGNAYGLHATGGQKSVQLTVDNMPAHGHDYSTRNETKGLCWAGDNDGVWQNEKWSSTTSAGGNQPHENLPPYRALFYIKRIR